MGDVVQLGGVTFADHSPDDILDRAERGLDYVLVCGVRKDGTRFFSASTSDAGRALVVMEHFKKDVITG